MSEQRTPDLADIGELLMLTADKIEDDLEGDDTAPVAAALALADVELNLAVAIDTRRAADALETIATELRRIRRAT